MSVSAVVSSISPKLKCKKKTLKMYLSRVTQLLVNVLLETEIFPRCCVLYEQAVFKN